MDSKQKNLRRLMKLEREKKSSTISAGGEPNGKNKKDAAGVKGILKSKSNYSSSSSSSPSSTTRKVKIGIKEDKLDTLSKHDVASTAHGNLNGDGDDEDDAMKEFEDFLDSVDVDDNDDSKETTDAFQRKDNDSTMKITQSDTSTAKQQKQKQLQKQNTKEPKENHSAKTKQQRNADEMELEQTAYEARLAKLMLLSRSKKRQRNAAAGNASNDNDNDDNNNNEGDENKDTSIAIDYTPQLAFVSERSAGKKSTTDSHKEEGGAKASIPKSAGGSATPTMKDMLRRKKAKLSKQSSKENCDDDFEDDSFWA